MHLQFRNGNSEFGAVHPDGSRETEFPNGETVTYRADGSFVTAYKNGNFDVNNPDGTVEHWRERTIEHELDGAPTENPERFWDHVATEKPGGSWHSYRPDGTVVTTNPTGR